MSREVQYRNTVQCLNHFDSKKSTLIACVVIIMVFLGLSEITNAQTVAIAEVTGGVATGTLTGGETDQAILGFSLTATGTATVQGITIATPNNPIGKFLNYRLYRSSNNTFSGVASESLLLDPVLTPDNSADEIDITNINQTFTGTRYYFLVVDINPAVTAAQTLEPSFASTDVTLAAGSVTGGPVTGETYSFALLSVTIAEVTGGVATGTLNGGDTDKAILGFSLAASGTPQVQGITVATPNNPIGKFLNYRLYRSTDNTFSGVASETLLIDPVLTPDNSPDEIVITNINETFTGTRYYFLVVDIDPGVTAAQTLEPSFASTDVTLAAGSVTGGPVTGETYSFAPLSVAIAEETGGVAVGTLNAGDTDQAILGFSLTASGTPKVQGITMATPNNPIGKFLNYRLYRSTDNTFSGVASETLLIDPVLTPDNSPDEIVITNINEMFTGTRYYFLVVDIDPAVTAAQTLEPSFASTDVTLAAGSVTGGPVTGETYSFAPLSVAIAKETGGVAVGTLNAGDTDKAILGFSLTATGTATVQGITVATPNNPIGKFLNYRLYRSTDNTFSSVASESLLLDPVITPDNGADEIVITTINQTFSGIRYYFLVVDIDPTVTAAQTLKPSFASADVTLAAGSVTGGPVTGETYSFAPLSVAIAEVTGGVATGTLVGGDTDKAILGFSLTATGTATVQGITIAAPDNPIGKLLNYRLYRSVDNIFSGVAMESLLLDPVLTPDNSPDEIVITNISETFTGTRYYFLVVDIDPAVTAAQTLEPSFASTDVTLAAGSVTGGPVTGETYSFAVPPDITSFAPNPVCELQIVTISGSNFTGASSVSIGTTTVLSTDPEFTFVNDNEIQVEIPIGTSDGQISVTNPNGTGTSAGTLTVNPVPTVTFNDPSGGTSYPNNAAAFDLLPFVVPQGGMFSGTGITNITLGTFDPVIAGTVGSPHTITYSYSSMGCLGAATKDLAVYDASAPTDLLPEYCEDEAPPVAVTEQNVPLGYSLYQISGPGIAPATPVPASYTFDPGSGAVAKRSVATPGAVNVITVVFRHPIGPPTFPDIVVPQNVVVQAVPVVEAGIPQTICLGDSVDLTTISASIGGGVIDGIWSSPSGSFYPNTGFSTAVSFKPASAGVVTLTLTSDASPSPCTGTVQDMVNITVEQNAIVTATPTQTVWCQGDPIDLASLGPSITGGTTTGNWYSPSGTAGFAPDNLFPSALTYNPTLAEVAAGMVNLTLRSDDPPGVCLVDSTIIAVTINLKAFVNAGMDQDICPGDPVNISSFGASITGGTTTGSWSSPSGSGGFSPTDVFPGALTYTPATPEVAAGSVILTLISDDPDGAGPSGPCPAEMGTVTVTIGGATVLNAGTPATICSEDLVSLPSLGASITGGVTTGTWSSPSGTSGFVPDNKFGTAMTYAPSVAEKTAGVVTLTLTSDPFGGCAPEVGTVDITISPAVVADPGLNDIICTGVSVDLGGAPTAAGGVSPFTYSWNVKGNATVFSTDPNPAVSPAASTTYELLVQDANMCFSPKEEVQISVNVVPALSLTGLEAAYCTNDESTTLTAFGGGIPVSATFEVQPPSGAPYGPLGGNVFDPATQSEGPGVYQVRFRYTDTNSCENISSPSPTTINPTPQADFESGSSCGEGVVSFTDNSISVSSAITSWAWNFGDGNTSMEQNPGNDYLVPNVYPVTLSVTNSNNCVDSRTLDITAGAPPEVAFRWEGVCDGVTTLFINETTIPFGTIDSWAWDFDNDGTVDSDLENPTWNFPAPGVYTVSLTAGAGTCFASLAKTVFTLPRVTLSPSQPYTETFEAGPGGWVTDTNTPTSWELDVPAGTTITSPGDRAWITDANGTYLSNEQSFVYGPCFDISMLDRPMIKLDTWRASAAKDGVVLEASGDGLNWNLIGDIGTGVEWYNGRDLNGSPGDQLVKQVGWSGLDNSWRESRHSLEEYRGSSLVQLRVAFGAIENIQNLDGFAFDDLFIGERNKIVLLEYFTNMDGNPQKDQDDAFVNNILDNNSSIAGIQYHTDFPSPDDPLNLFNKADPSARALYYGILQTTTSVLDGNDYLGETQGWSGDDVNLLSLQSAQFLIDLDFSKTTETEYGLEVTWTSLEALAGNFKLHVAVVNNDLTSSGRSNHNVLNRLVPDAAGTLLPANLATNQSGTISLSWVPFSDRDIQDLKVLAFIQDDVTKEVFQTKIQVPDKVPTLLGVVGIPQVTVAEDDLRLYPNPASASTHLDFSTPVSLDEIQLNLIDQSGRQFEPEVLSGKEGSITLHTRDYPSGLYILRVIRGEKVMHKKLLIRR